ncbi:MAG: HAD family hydrolase [Anaerolineae bacterium]|nr:HAD family hydrolase [Anaerolineae bacterium]
MKIKLIVLDADGVLSKGEAQAFDLSLLARLADLNQRSRQGEPVPAVTLNTGRPSAYVEAVLQAIHGWQPALYESGAGLYRPQTYQFEITPLLTVGQRDLLAEVLAEVDRRVVQSGRAYWQPGKMVCHTLFAHPPLTIADIRAEVEHILANTSGQIVATPAVLALNIQPTGIDKGSGLQWLAQTTGIDPTEIAGAGDSSADIDFLRLVGHPAAPANATEAVKAAVGYVSTKNDAGGLHEILDYWIGS